MPGLLWPVCVRRWRRPAPVKNLGLLLAQLLLAATWLGRRRRHRLAQVEEGEPTPEGPGGRRRRRRGPAAVLRSAPASARRLLLQGGAAHSGRVCRGANERGCSTCRAQPAGRPSATRGNPHSPPLHGRAAAAETRTGSRCGLGEGRQRTAGGLQGGRRVRSGSPLSEGPPHSVTGLCYYFTAMASPWAVAQSGPALDRPVLPQGPASVPLGLWGVGDANQNVSRPGGVSVKCCSDGGGGAAAFTRHPDCRRQALATPPTQPQ